MTEHKELPIEQPLPPGIEPISYKFAYNRLYEYVCDPGNENVSNFEELSIKTSAVGEDLALLLRGEGYATIQYFTYYPGSIDEYQVEKWRWTMCANMGGKYLVYAILYPEHNDISISKSDLNYKLYHCIYVPILTSEYSIDVESEVAPSAVLYSQGHEYICYPTKTPENLSVLQYYAGLLYQGVSDLMRVFPNPNK